MYCTTRKSIKNQYSDNIDGSELILRVVLSTVSLLTGEAGHDIIILQSKIRKEKKYGL